MKKFFALILLLGSLTATLTGAFETSLPEREGLSSGAVLAWVNAVESEVDALHSFVLVRHGKVVAEGWWAPYEKERPHMLYSLSKSFTSTAIGMAISEGRLALDDRVISFFPDKLPPEPSDNLKNMRVRDLLCMGSGHHNDTLGPMKEGRESDWIKLFFAQPVEHEPGTYFRYNTGATYMLSAILQQTTGENLMTYLTPRLFIPLGIEGATWESSPQGITTGGYGLKVRTRDIAALGELYLQKGRWKGRQLLPEQWVAMASSRQIANGDNPASDWNQGYGFQFWRCRHNAFRGDGAFGQYCIVMPDQNAVLAITSGAGDMQKVLNLVWTHLLPGMQTEPLPPDAANRMRLSNKLAALTLPPVRGERQPGAEALSGQTYTFAENAQGIQSLTLDQSSDGVTLKLRNIHGEQQIHCGFGSWTKGGMIFEKDLIRPVGEANGRQVIAASGAWTAPALYTACLYFHETPFRLTISLHFTEERLNLELEYNVAFSGNKKWQLTGQKAAQ